MKSTSIYLSLGGNEGKVLPRLRKALALLTHQPEIANLKTSHFYQTAPVQVDSSAWFVNAVCSFQTSLAPDQVFEITQAIEIQLGKINKPKNASRPIDIDILFYGNQMRNDPPLEIPHPHWKERLFVLIPLKDLTEEVIFLNQEGEIEHYVLQNLIHPLSIQFPQAVSLLEKNPGLQ